MLTIGPSEKIAIHRRCQRSAGNREKRRLKKLVVGCRFNHFDVSAGQIACRRQAEKMLSFAMNNTPGDPPRTTLTKAQCAEALDLFEKGVMNGAQIARHLGVGRHVVYRYLKAVGAVEGRMIPEHVARLNAEIDARQHARRIQRWADEERRLDAFDAHVAVVGKFIDAVVEASRQGRLAEFGKRLPRL